MIAMRLWFFGEGDRFLKIDEAHGGIGGRRRRGLWCAEREVVDAGKIGFDLADGDAEARENVSHEAIGSAIELREEMIRRPGFECGEQRWEMAPCRMR